MRSILLAAVLAAAAIVPARAELTEFREGLSASVLHSYCVTPVETSPSSVACLAYISGWVEHMQSMQMRAASAQVSNFMCMIAIPNSVTNGQLAAIVVRYFTQHRNETFDRRPGSAGLLLERAFSAQFGCGQ